MPVVVVMGVAGSGKTTIGSRLAERLDVPYAEADSFHPPANVAKMSAGRPLTDADRGPWLQAIADWIRRQPALAIVTSSALKRRYRDVLRSGGDLFFIHLDAPRELVAERMRRRVGHFMPVSLLDSQYADLEPLGPDERGIVLDIRQPVETIVDTALAEIARRFGVPDETGGAQ